MSDMLQLVVVTPNTQRDRNAHSLTYSDEVECWQSRRQAEAYRTFVERFLLG
jgi:hypothetical protein